MIPVIDPRPSSVRAKAAGWMLAGLACLVALGGCSTGAIVGAGEPGRSGRRTPLEISDAGLAELGFRPDWKGFPYVSPRGRLVEMTIDAEHDVVLARESGSSVSILDGTSGRRRWRSQLATRLTKFISLTTGSYQGRDVCFASSEADVYLLDLDTGDLLDRQTYEKVVNAGPVVLGGGLLVYGTASGEVLAHNLNVSFKAWGFDLPGSIDQPPILVGGAIGAVASEGSVVFLGPSTGQLWSQFSIFDGIATKPVATDDGLMIVAGLDQSLWAFDPRAGRVVWRERTPSPLLAQPAYHDGAVFCEIPARGLTAFDSGSGEQQWANPEVSGTVIGTRAGKLLVWDGRHLALVSPENGAMETRIELPTVAHIAMDDFVDGNLYVADNAGAIAKLVPTF